jgi:hypothetical protein
LLRDIKKRNQLVGYFRWSRTVSGSTTSTAFTLER